mmetsp:Transcript_8105/g.34095  ORF Transcript_8105/g.34095 Transcript_8105/m.34095 type:complete len:549 (-) Transcript_8105:375-2021(-)
MCSEWSAEQSRGGLEDILALAPLHLLLHLGPLLALQAKALLLVLLPLLGLLAVLLAALLEVCLHVLLRGLLLAELAVRLFLARRGHAHAGRREGGSRLLPWRRSGSGSSTSRAAEHRRREVRVAARRGRGAAALRAERERHRRGGGCSSGGSGGTTDDGRREGLLLVLPGGRRGRSRGRARVTVRAKAVLASLPGLLQPHEDLDRNEGVVEADRREVDLGEVLQEEGVGLALELVDEVRLASVRRHVRDVENLEHSALVDAVADLVLANAEERVQLVPARELNELAGRQRVDVVVAVVEKLQHALERRRRDLLLLGAALLEEVGGERVRVRAEDGLVAADRLAVDGEGDVAEGHLVVHLLEVLQKGVLGRLVGRDLLRRRGVGLERGHNLLKQLDSENVDAVLVGDEVVVVLEGELHAESLHAGLVEVCGGLEQVEDALDRHVLAEPALAEVAKASQLELPGGSVQEQNVLVCELGEVNHASVEELKHALHDLRRRDVLNLDLVLLLAARLLVRRKRKDLLAAAGHDGSMGVNGVTAHLDGEISVRIV